MKQTFDFRKIGEQDKELLERMQNDEEFKKYFIPDSKADLVLLNGEVIGACYINRRGYPEIQLGILPEHRNKGYGSALLKQLLNELHDESEPIIFGRVHKDNKASLSMARKCGFIIDWENEELNPNNKEDMYYKLYKRNYLADKIKRSGR